LLKAIQLVGDRLGQTVNNVKWSAPVLGLAILPLRHDCQNRAFAAIAIFAKKWRALIKLI